MESAQGSGKGEPWELADFHTGSSKWHSALSLFERKTSFCSWTLTVSMWGVLQSHKTDLECLVAVLGADLLMSQGKAQRKDPTSPGMLLSCMNTERRDFSAFSTSVKFSAGSLNAKTSHPLYISCIYLCFHHGSLPSVSEFLHFRCSFKVSAQVREHYNT